MNTIWVTSQQSLFYNSSDWRNRLIRVFAVRMSFPGTLVFPQSIDSSYHTETMNPVNSFSRDTPQKNLFYY